MGDTIGYSNGRSEKGAQQKCCKDPAMGRILVKDGVTDPSIGNEDPVDRIESSARARQLEKKLVPKDKLQEGWDVSDNLNVSATAA
jgi:hypothetical protein